MSEGEAKGELTAEGDASSQKEERAPYLSAEVNLGRRYFIIGATGGVASVGVLGSWALGALWVVWGGGESAPPP